MVGGADSHLRSEGACRVDSGGGAGLGGSVCEHGVSRVFRGGGAADGYAAALHCVSVPGADSGGVDLDVDEGGVRGASEVARGFCRRPKVVPTYNEVR